MSRGAAAAAALAVPALEPELPDSPYPGLRPFEKREWPVFFGRERMTEEVVDRLLERQLVFVHGSSGSGKSSLVRAGVLPRLEQYHARGGGVWRTCAMRPGDDPLGFLALALAGLAGGTDPLPFLRLLNRGRDAAPALAGELRLGPGERACVLLDQFEELFQATGREAAEEARLFADVLVGLAGEPPPGLYAVATMRSEFLGHCARFPGLVEAVNRTQYLLPPLERPDLLRAIREPATLYGGEVEAPLAERLVADAADSKDPLPLIQHALMLLWREAEAGTGERPRAAPAPTS